MTILPNIDHIALSMYEAASTSRRNGRHYLGMSEIGGPCDRALWLEFRGYKANPVDGRLIMLFRFGDRIEEDVIHWLILAGYKVDGRQDTFSDFDGLFLGHCDGIVHGVTSLPHILEVKSANDAKFKSFKSVGVQKTYPQYFAQAQCYMGYAQLERALFVIQNKNTSEVYTERIYFADEIFKSLRERAKRIIYAERLPDPPLEPNSQECRWCGKSMVCRNMEDVMADAVCGTCHFFGFGKELKRVCRHPAHPVEIRQWGVGCPEWSDQFEKFMGTDPRPKKVGIE